MKRFLFALILFFFLSPNYWGQTFLGKRFFAEIGVTYRPNLLNVTQWSDQHFVKWNPFPPSFQAGVGLAISPRISMRFGASVQQHQISGVIFQDDYLFDTINQLYIDTIYFDSKSVDFSFELRYYQEYAPIGRYFSAHGSLVNTHTTLLPVTSYWNVTPATFYHVNDRLNETKVTYNSIKLGVGFGRTQLLARNIFLDVGFKTSFVFVNQFISDEEFATLIESTKTPFYKTGYSIDYTDSGSRTLKSGAWRNLQNSYLLEVYFNLGLSL